MILICISTDGSDTLIFLGIQLKQYLMRALMRQRKSAFSAEFPNIRWFNEALVQNHIIGFQEDAPLTSINLYLIFCIHIRVQTVDASIRGQLLK